MSERDAVTVVVPTRNRRPILTTTLQSILAQQEVALSVVVVDDASTDDSNDWLAAHPDARLQVIRHGQPTGPSAARNDGLAAADTHWVAFCDDDDLWSPTKLAAQLHALRNNHHAGWSCTGTVSVDDSLDVIGHQRPYLGDDLRGALRVENVIPGGGSTVLAERSVLLDAGGWDETLPACEDFDLWCRLAQRSEMAPVDAPLVAYRVWSGSRSADPRLMGEWQDHVLARYRGDHVNDIERSALRRDQYLGRFLLRRRQRGPAARHFFQMAIRYRLWTHLVHAAVALTSPRLALHWADFRERGQVPIAWQGAADRWLDAYRNTTVAA